MQQLSNAGRWVRILSFLITLACLLLIFQPLSQASVTAQVSSNTGWGNALAMPGVNPALRSSVGVITQSVDAAGESRWFKVPAVPGSRFTLTLAGSDLAETLLGANLDLALYGDLPALYNQLAAPMPTGDLTSLATVAANVSPANSYAAAYFPATYFPATYFPATYFPATYFPATYFPATYFPATYFGAEPEQRVVETRNLNQTFQPPRLPTAYFPPVAGTPPPPYLLANIYQGVLSRALLRVSTAEGNAPEAITFSPQTTGNLYVRVSWRAGAGGTNGNFTLRAELDNYFCESTALGNLTKPKYSAPPGEKADYNTLILTRFDRLDGTELEKRELRAKLATFSSRPEVKGKVLDFSSNSVYERVNEAFELATKTERCPFLLNRAANEIKEVINEYENIKYIVVAGSDDVIPFFRYPDRAGVANEYDYIPPAKTDKPGRSTLLNGLLLSQDEYGVSGKLDLAEYQYPLPQRPVGRLVGNADDIGGLLQAYIDTNGEVNIGSSFVTGYEFSRDTARQAATELQLATGNPPQELISDTWSAAELEARLVATRHDLTFVSGHASAGTLAAADYSPLRASKLDGTPVDQTNSIYLGLGCHSLYNIAPNDNIPGASANPDWAVAFARRKITAIGGTAFQYGSPVLADTAASIDYGEKLYLEIVSQLNTKMDDLDEPVAIGQALVRAKRRYLATRTPLQGIHEKTALVATLYGLPMLKVNTLRTSSPIAEPSVVSSVAPVTSAPGLPLRLHTADISITPVVTKSQAIFGNNVYDYFSGASGSTSNPFEPILGQELTNVSVPGKVLRGAGWRGGMFSTSTSANKGVLTKSPATEFEPALLSFNSLYFHPAQPWEINYFDSLTGGTNTTRLALFPVQYRSKETATGVPEPDGFFRQFENMQFRLYYSNYGVQSGDNISRPELVSPPVIEDVRTALSGNILTFKVTVGSPPDAGIQEVWLNLNSSNLSSRFYRNWLALDLTPFDSSRQIWTTTLNLASESLAPGELEFMVQAVNGLGMVTFDTNGGRYYRDTPSLPAPTVQPSLSLELPPGGSVRFLDNPLITATMTPSSAVLPLKETVQIQIGQLRAQVTINEAGRAVLNLNPLAPDLKLTLASGAYNLTAYYAGNADYKSATAVVSLTVVPITTNLSLLNLATPDNLSGIVAEYSDGRGVRLEGKPVFFVGTDASAGYTFGAIAATDKQGHAKLGLPRWPAGKYTVCVYTGGGDIPVFGQYYDFYYTPQQACRPTPSYNIDLTVRNPAEIGDRDAPETLSYALARVSLGTPPWVVNFALPTGTDTITVSGRLPAIQPGIRLDGGICGTPPNKLVGNATYPNLPGLVLRGNNLLRNLYLSNFSASPLRLNGYANRLECVRVAR